MSDGNCISLYDKETLEALYQSGLAYLGKKEKIYLSGDVDFISKRNAFPGEAEYAEGMECLERAAEQGYLKAQTALGDLYWSGVEVSLRGTSAHVRKRDKEKGLYWYKMAAGQGNKLAASRVGDYYQYRWSVTECREDMDEAVSWYIKGGSYKEAAMMLVGSDSPDDYERAISLYKKSLESGGADIVDFLEYDDGVDNLRYARHFERELDRYANSSGEVDGINNAEVEKLKNNALRCYERALMQYQFVVNEIERKIDSIKNN